MCKHNFCQRSHYPCWYTILSMHKIVQNLLEILNNCIKHRSNCLDPLDFSCCNNVLGMLLSASFGLHLQPSVICKRPHTVWSVIDVLSCGGGGGGGWWPQNGLIPLGRPRQHLPTSREMLDQHVIETGMKRYKGLWHGFREGMQLGCNLTDELDLTYQVCCSQRWFYRIRNRLYLPSTRMWEKPTLVLNVSRSDHTQPRHPGKAIKIIFQSSADFMFHSLLCLNRTAYAS